MNTLPPGIYEEAITKTKKKHFIKNKQTSNIRRDIDLQLLK